MNVPIIVCLFTMVVLSGVNGNEFLDNKRIQRLLSCRRKIGASRLQNCTNSANIAWGLDDTDIVQLILNRQSICCAQWQTHDCKLALAEEYCDRQEFDTMVYRMEKIRIMNQRTICADYKYHQFQCRTPAEQTTTSTTTTPETRPDWRHWSDCSIDSSAIVS